ncbi:Methionine synthase [Fundidesulfovibrio magnetotacticus]|uniref:Methionine synthase n=1 Tax=Fundidesulfovibrio magnetotacticus TaxID=2730080 RepID=A0A6V8LSP9_9BACT|nr:homocysteine S-methyltransferase family protein [Fundidesulfovibrio magnetotacticus]GFK95503.1 Methionine synthase [Fundidesulfovibrio magnetotacticus]
MTQFRKALAGNSIIVFDGAMGTLLQARGLPAGASPELWGLANPDPVRQVHEDYLRAGARVVTTNTFGGTRFKLPAGTDIRALNAGLTRVARQAAGENAFVAGSVGPTGHFVEPLGTLTMRELVDAFARQIEGLVDGGADLIIAETHFDLAEAKAMVLAARQVCDLPVAVLMTFEPGGSLTGTSPATFADTMQNLGVDLLGINCGLGPEQMLDLARDFMPRIDTPFFIKPNAGLPRLENGVTVFPMGPEAFGEAMVPFLEMGAKCVSGCCGTTPAHIAALAARAEGRVWTKPQPAEGRPLVLTSRARSVSIGVGLPAVVIGERINPTGKKALTAELQAGQFGEALRLAEEQVQAGAAVLDVNVGAPMVDEAALLPGLAKELTARFLCPLCLDSTNPKAIEEALWAVPGSALVNSISGEPGRMEELGPLCKLHGAPFILLPLAGKKLPVTATERIAAIEALLVKAESLGIPRRLILVDALALTVSSKPEAARHCLETIRHCAAVWGLPTTLGLSNISFGLPARELLNATFLSMCLGAGMAAHISNPSTPLPREVGLASEVLLARDPQAGRFIENLSAWKYGGGEGPAAPKAQARVVTTLREAVVAGRREALLPMVEEALAQGRKAQAILSEDLVPGIMDVGVLYERKEYFLPQLLLSAETMQAGFDRLKPLLEEGQEAQARPKIVLATVEGDIHDIGKNIVGLMLRNHGFEVIDLGKDVSAERIVEAARESGAPVIGLSALMTTTMVRMEDTVRLLRERGMSQKVMVGGAVVTDAFARSIGADGHAADAVEAVRLVKRLMDA